MSVEWRGGEVSREVKNRARQGVAEGVNVVWAAAQPLTPFREGMLRASFVQLMPVDTGGVLIGGLASNLVYAAYQHELPEGSRFTTPGTGPKFLERALDQQQEAIATIIGNYVKGRL